MGKRSSTFDWLRLAGACVVVLGHSWYLLGLPPLWGVGWHLYGLELFFLVSGYLVTGSWQASATAGQYAEKRIRRIMPALVVVVLLTSFALGPIMTTDPKYFADPETYKYVWRNVALLPVETLPGVFKANPLSAVNGSLWTIPLEVLMYALTPLLVRLGPWVCIAVVVAMRLHPLTGFIADYDVAGAGWITKFFLIGAALKMWGARMPDLRLPAVPADLSYGVYLTAFPVQQSIIALYPHIGPVALTASALAACAPLAWLSWTFVERPVMRRHAGSPKNHATVEVSMPLVDWIVKPTPGDFPTTLTVPIVPPSW